MEVSAEAVGLALEVVDVPAALVAQVEVEAIASDRVV